MRINLLPWREQARKSKKKGFALSIVGVIMLAIVVIIVMTIYYKNLITNQQQRNKYLQAIIAHENAYILEINKRKQQLTAINNELKFIISLRDNSYDAVRALDQLAKVVPDGVSFLSIGRDGKEIVINGRAKSDSQVTQFMGNITNSGIFLQPVLTNITSRTNNQIEERQFQINVAEKGTPP